MPSITHALIEPLRKELSLYRAVETGAYRGDGAVRLGAVFPEVVTIELSEHYAQLATTATRLLSHVRVVHGHSADVIPALVDPAKPTLWFLDGHWSAGDTAGADDECPVLREVHATRGGHADDVIVIDDARLFLSSPPAPLNPAQWPTLLQVLDAIRAVHPDHHVTTLNDQIIAVPPRARTALDSYANSVTPTSPTLTVPVVARALADSLRYRLRRSRGRLARFSPRTRKGRQV